MLLTKINSTRFEQELDCDKVTLTIETDGTVTPEEVLGYAARVLQDQLQLTPENIEEMAKKLEQEMLG